jgi:hypothetical protein
LVFFRLVVIDQLLPCRQILFNGSDQFVGSLVDFGRLTRHCNCGFKILYRAAVKRMRVCTNGFEITFRNFFCVAGTPFKR